jgi:mannose-6-phosphate isomerase
MKLYPLKFQPIFKERIWGGRNLEKVFGKQLPPENKIGESWELADVGPDKSKVANGPLAGKNIAELVEQFKADITGKADNPPPFPLLIKILDATDVLSVQVHPDSQTCQQMGKGQPKTECWYIISAEPAAVIYKGLKPGTTEDDFAQAILAGNTAELLNKVEVKPGECHFLPAGTPHAIGAGLLIAEIQTPSDTTYRVFDWNRVDENGNSRQLHIDEAVESINFQQNPDELTVASVGRLVDADVFKVDKGHQTKGCEMLLDTGQMRVIIFLDGIGSITSEQNPPTAFAKGDTILIPASCQSVLTFTGETQYLVVSC